MGHYDKLYRDIKNNPNNVTFKDIHILLTKVGGFKVRNNGSSHYVYYHTDLVDNITIPKNRPVKPIYIKKALKAFESVVKGFGQGGI